MKKADSLCPPRTLADGHAACLNRGGVIKSILVTGCWVNWLWQLIDMSGSLYITLQSHNPLSKESKSCRSISPRWTGWPTLNGVYQRCTSPCVRIHSPSPSPSVAILVFANASRKTSERHSSSAHTINSKANKLHVSRMHSLGSWAVHLIRPLTEKSSQFRANETWFKNNNNKKSTARRWHSVAVTGSFYICCNILFCVLKGFYWLEYSVSFQKHYLE